MLAILAVLARLAILAPRTTLSLDSNICLGRASIGHIDTCSRNNEHCGKEGYPKPSFDLKLVHDKHNL